MTMEKNNDQAAALESLFSLSREAVLGVYRTRVIFCNDAARRLFDRELRELPLAEALPELASVPEGDSFVAAATVRGRLCTVTAVHHRSVLVLTVHPQSELSGSAGAALISRLRMAAFGMRVALDALAEKAGPGEAAYQAYHSYYSMLHRLEQLSDVSCLVRSELPFRKQPVELAGLVRDLTGSVTALAGERQTPLTCSVPDEPCLIEGDRERLEQMLLILLSNAMLHTPPDGRISVTVQRDKGLCLLAVDDSGEGIGSEELSYVFSLREDAPLTAAASGAGMGLYIVQGIARLHGGTAILRSVPGQGTRVRISLPVSDRLRIHDAVPGSGRPDLILSELSGVLPDEAYDARYRD